MLGQGSLCTVLGDKVHNTLLLLAQDGQLLPGACLDTTDDWKLGHSLKV